jgi:hypothetical protein
MRLRGRIHVVKELTTLHLLRRVRAEERGIALILALLVLTSVSIIAASAIDYSTHETEFAASGAARANVSTLAEAGLNIAGAILANPANDPTSSSLLPSSDSPGSTSIGDGTAYYWGSYDGSTMTWTVWGKGSVRNPSAPNAITHTVSEQFLVSPGGGTGGVWGYIFANNPGSCMTLANSVQVSQPIYVKGNLCLDNSAQIASSASPLNVGGTIQVTSSATVGSSASPLAVLHVGGGCRYGTSGSYVTPCTSTQHVYATSQDTTVPSLTKPTIDLNYWYSHAQPGPQHSCTSGSFPGGFDNDGTMNASLSSVDLMPSSSYSCVVTSGSTTVGRISWTTGNPGTLTVSGTIFIDGNINMTGSGKGVYSGLGTIYASGTINLAGSIQICAVYASGQCDWTHWNPTTTMLVLVAGSSTAPDVTLGQSMMFQGALYANTDYSQGSSVEAQASVVANNISLTSSSQSGMPTITSVPVGAPGGGYSVAAIRGTFVG